MTSSHLLPPEPTVLRDQPRKPSNGVYQKSAPSTPHLRPSTSMTAASPEVITSLVESLSKISGPPTTQLYGPGTSFTSMFPTDTGGAASDVAYAPYILPDEAAYPPVVRTSKPTSGFSPLKNTSEDACKRMSFQSGVDIPSYVRNYMNRAEREETHSRKDSWNSTRRSRLNCVSSKERVKRGSMSGSWSLKSVDRDNLKESRLTPGAVLSTNATGSNDDINIKLPTLSTRTSESDLVGGRQIPVRKSSQGKGSHRISCPSNVVTTAPPTTQTPLPSPLPSPTFKATGGQGGPAPPPGLAPKKDAKNLKRRSSPPSLFSASNKQSLTSPPGTQKANRHNSNPLPSPTYDERPSSADSIDDAVDAYLRSPRLSQKLRMPTTGRMISFSEVGDANGFAVFCCVGMGLTRFVTAFYDELALTLGLRLITLDRPGVGDSDGIEESARAVLNWPDDVLYVCQSLKITKFTLLAHSAGAIYALATALRMPGHIRGKIHLLAPWIPPSQMTAMEAQIAAGAGGKSIGKVGTVPTTQRILKAIPTPLLKVANSSFMSATSSSLTSSIPKSPSRRAARRRDRGGDLPTFPVNTNATNEPSSPTDGSSPERNSGNENASRIDGRGKGNINSGDNNNNNAKTFSQDLASEEAAMLRAEALAAANKERQSTYDQRLTHAIWQLATRGANPAVDLLVCLERTRPVGFRYVDITKPVVIHHGTRDTRVPLDNVRWLGRMMRKCEVRELRGEGHGLMASALVMGSVLEEIATEWREWKREVEAGGGRSRSGTVGTIAGYHIGLDL